MKAETVIREKISDEGMGLSRKLLADIAMAEINADKVTVFHYNRIVLTVDKEGLTPEVHLYSMEDGMAMRGIGNRFMRDLWLRTPHKRVFARTNNPKVQRLAEIFGWKLIGNDLNQNPVYMTERSLS